VTYMQAASRNYITAVLVSLLVVVASGPAIGNDALTFPVVFGKASDLRKLGLVLHGFTNDSGSVAHFPHRCYYYGDGGQDISFSDEFLARFKARGFSRRSLCMALVSEVLFDPQTGARLPSYVLARYKDGSQPGGSGDVSEDLPLDVPDCFKDGMPLTDCVWNYDPKTGKRLKQADITAIGAIGKRIQTLLARYGSDCRAKETNGTLFASCKELGYDDAKKLRSPESCSCTPAFSDWSSEFPKGFGYALNADGTAGPDPSAEAADQAVNPKRRATESKIEELRNVLSNPSR
jgi:hypothetical protein